MHSKDIAQKPLYVSLIPTDKGDALKMVVVVGGGGGGGGGAGDKHTYFSLLKNCVVCWYLCHDTKESMVSIFLESISLE